MDVKSRSATGIAYIRIPRVVLLRRRHFEYRHMQLSYLNKAMVFTFLSEIFAKNKEFYDCVYEMY